MLHNLPFHILACSHRGKNGYTYKEIKRMEKEGKKEGGSEERGREGKREMEKKTKERREKRRRVWFT